jgi:hypothetical protein
MYNAPPGSGSGIACGRRGGVLAELIANLAEAFVEWWFNFSKRMRRWFG